MRDARTVGADAIRHFAERIDVRSPAEFGEDHVPGAASHPVLSDEERATVGTLHASSSAFVAKRAGAAIVARNIAAMLEGPFADKPRDWAPLVYCWRGGKRSGALTHVLNEIGWRAVQLDGGYRAYRRWVREELLRVPTGFSFRVVCGLTGSGKSRLLRALAQEGAQVLDLEELAAHRGSLLGGLPDAPQPGQKRFESAVLDILQHLDPTRPVFVESESKRIGALQVPDALLERMRASPCITLELAPVLRTALLREEYAHFLDDIDSLATQLAPLTALHGRATIERWTDAARAGEWDTFVAELLTQHYDPTYARAIDRNFPRHSQGERLRAESIDENHYRSLARVLIERHDAAHAVSTASPT